MDWRKGGRVTLAIAFGVFVPYAVRGDKG